jgi:hypothetical protein
MDALRAYRFAMVEMDVFQNPVFDYRCDCRIIADFTETDDMTSRPAASY